MDRVHFNVLYGEFLFRVIDRDLLSVHADGDSSKLLGRIAAVLVWLSLPFAGVTGMIASGATISPVHSVVSTTMLLVMVLCVLSWDALLPDRRDVFVLAPLGVGASTIVAARLAALLVAVGTAVAVFNALPGVICSLAVLPRNYNLLQIVFSTRLYRGGTAYAVAMMAAGLFVVLGVTAIQAVVAQLPPKTASRCSGVTQLLTLVAGVCTYFLQPSWSGRELAALAEQGETVWLPPYWFVGLFWQINGYSQGPEAAALGALANQAWCALALSGVAATIAVAVSCATALRRLSEQPELTSRRTRHLFPWSFGHSLSTAIVQWTARTLIRSRMHRMLVTFYAAAGFAAVILFLQAPRVQVMVSPARMSDAGVFSVPLIGSSFVMLLAWCAGIRAVFPMPIEIRANWIFRVTLAGPVREALAGTRLALVCTGLVPAVLVAAAVFGSLWQLMPATQHVFSVALLGLGLIAVLLKGFHKIPFTCSYLPGTSHLHITVAVCVLLGLNAVFWAARFESQSLTHLARFMVMAGALFLGVVVLWWQLAMEQLPSSLIFEQKADPALTTLELHGIESTETGYSTPGLPTI